MRLGTPGKQWKLFAACVFLLFCIAVYRYFALDDVYRKSTPASSSRFFNQVISKMFQTSLTYPASGKTNWRTTERRQKAPKRLPHIIAIGSKKCGTGAFQSFIQYHSKVVIPYRNWTEPHFFDQNYGRGLTFYKSMWPSRKSKDQVLFEKTPKYLVSEAVPQRILESYRNENLPTPKFVLISCDPVHRAFSDYSQARRKCSPVTKCDMPFDTFDKFVDHSIAKIRNVTSTTTDVIEFYKHVNALYEDKLLKMVLRGVYSYFLKGWFQIFPKSDFVFVDADELLRDPGNAMLKAQEKLGLSPELQPKNFEFVPQKGFFCVKLSDKKKQCMGDGKGNTRTINNGTVTQAKLSEYAKVVLGDFYEPFNKEFIQLSEGLGLDWL